MTVLVTGATGTLGRPTVAGLRAAGHTVRALSRRPGPDRVVGDLLTGEGLRDAVDGVDTVVHLASGPKRDDDATGNLLDAAGAAGVRHVVHMSIVGIDDIPLGYYRGKVAAERVVESSVVPWTILRATQFHDLVEKILRAQRYSPAVLAPAFALQPIAADEVAGRLVELAAGEPAGRVPDIGGPAVRPVPDLARAWRRATGSRRPVVPVRLPGRLFGAYAAGHALVAGPAYGRTTFEEHLARRAGA